ncbi:MAG: 4-hydroxythreonine-4-phosphate dehydrogenase PdxA [Chitinophagales bacterium]
MENTNKKNKDGGDSEMPKVKIGISIGDINSVSTEIIIKTFKDERMFKYCVPIIYGSSRVISYYKKVLQDDDFNYNIITSVKRAKEGVCNVLNCWTEDVPITIGRPNPVVGKFALRAIESAMYDLNEGELDMILTAPVNKSLLNTSENPFPGHTEYITQKFEGSASMMFLVSNQLRVGLVTNHVPVQDIAKNISEKLIMKKLRIMHDSLKRDFGIVRPKIAVLGLNPHAGDSGLIGHEEEEIIIPTLEKAKNDNMLVFGPYAADGFFGMGLYKQFDAILAMYHDQGLVPFKTLSFGHGVNFTAGLPIVRTSPDHGTAYDIAGKNIASEQSFREAIFMGIDVIRHRQNFDEMNANPLKKASRVRGSSYSDKNIREDNNEILEDENDLIEKNN